MAMAGCGHQPLVGAEAVTVTVIGEAAAAVCPLRHRGSVGSVAAGDGAAVPGVTGARRGAEEPPFAVQPRQGTSRERLWSGQGSWKFPGSCWEPLWGTETEVQTRHSTAAPSPFRTGVFAGTLRRGQGSWRLWGLSRVAARGALPDHSCGGPPERQLRGS